MIKWPHEKAVDRGSNTYWLDKAYADGFNYSVHVCKQAYAEWEANQDKAKAEYLLKVDDMIENMNAESLPRLEGGNECEHDFVNYQFVENKRCRICGEVEHKSICSSAAPITDVPCHICGAVKMAQGQGLDMSAIYEMFSKYSTGETKNLNQLEYEVVSYVEKLTQKPRIN